MKSEINISESIIDNIDIICEELKEGNGFKLLIYDGTEEEDPCVGMWIEFKNATIMFDLTKKQAAFFGKSLLSISENI